MIVASSKLEILDGKVLRREVPAIFAAKPINKVSDRYQFISTIDLVAGMKSAGLVPVEARQYDRRDSKLTPFSRHMIKFRPVGSLNKVTEVGGTVPQVILINSHDRSAAFSLMAGLYRLVCSNGLVTPAGFDASVSVKHYGGNVETVVAEALKMVEKFGGVYKLVEAMMKLKLAEKAQLAFARKALSIKEDSQNPRALSIEAADLLAVRRKEDDKPDLWHVFNRVQENIIKGGVIAHGKDNRERVTRPVTSLVTDLRLNRGIWELAVDTLKKAA